MIPSRNPFVDGAGNEWVHVGRACLILMPVVQGQVSWKIGRQTSKKHKLKH
jgi:hypothetical protein